MRITQNSLTLNFLRNLNAGLQRLSELQQALASGKRIRSASDDPTSLPPVLSLRSTLDAISQYARNLQDTTTLLAGAETAIGNAIRLAQRIRELAVQASTDTTSEADLQAIRAEVSALLDELVAEGNACIAGRYVFAGTRTTLAPFVRQGNAVTYQGNDGALEREVDVGVIMSASLPGSQVFAAGGNGIFPVTERLLDALDAGDRQSIRSALTGLDRALEALLLAQATAGARTNRVEVIQARAAELDVHLRELLSNREDADIAGTIMELRLQENVYQSALAAGARLLQPTLLEFLR